MSNKPARLHATIAAVCPITGVSIPTMGDSSTVRIEYGATATAPQKAAAQSALAAFDWSDAAQTAWEAAQKPELTAIQQAAANAISTNDAFLALASPTNAQTLAQVKALTLQNTRVIKRLIQLTG